MTYLFTVERFQTGPQGTIGRLRGPDGAFICHTLEDPHHKSKIYGDTCIPAGEYALGEHWGGKFFERYAKWAWHSFVIHVQNVPGFTWILWHIGNTKADTHGCLLLGRWTGAKGFIGDSKTTYERVYKIVAPLVKTGRARVRYVDLDGWTGK